MEIDPAGCSYNPDAELHQEAVAAAVAAENRKLLAKVRAGGECRAGLRVLGLLAAGAAAKRYALVASVRKRCSLERGRCRVLAASCCPALHCPGEACRLERPSAEHPALPLELEPVVPPSHNAACCPVRRGHHWLVGSLLLVPQELEPVAPPRTVDYDVETDELALLQVGGPGTAGIVAVLL